MSSFYAAPNSKIAFAQKRKVLKESQKSQSDLAANVVFPQTLNTYLGQKGYTVPKSELSDNQIQTLKELLTARPFQMGVVVNKTFPIYRESAKKIYMPRYFGEEYFGQPKSIQISEGDNIDVDFRGTLRDHQIPAVNAYMEGVHAAGADHHFGGLLELSCAAGKTVMSLYIISQLKKKTLIIVNKEFLLNQWIERIQEFLPTARVGRIQGPVIDIADKDIVIGMLQSLSMKDYPANTFDSFGLTIADEVHHISSEVFSCALFKIVTKYTLGLSATMERKDGTTNIIKMFLGDVRYKSITNDGHSVFVRAIEYRTNDEEFQETEYDYRGQPKYSTMISKLCDYQPRSDFIVRCVCDLVKESPKNQIMVLGHNRSLLVYLHDAIQAQKLATIGYYLGGMKQKDLQETETKQIVMATFAMAAEALDIKTLSTLVMVTPKTDIVQSVGRILRTKHSNPIIVDFVDMHQVFQNQWQKRRIYYKKCNYDIQMIDSKSYHDMINGTWRQIYTPKKTNACASAGIKNEDDEIIPPKCMIDTSMFSSKTI
jgi:superfamily II DNA or RNA helicase